MRKAMIPVTIATALLLGGCGAFTSTDPQSVCVPAIPHSPTAKVDIVGPIATCAQVAPVFITKPVSVPSNCTFDPKVCSGWASMRCNDSTKHPGRCVIGCPDCDN